MYEKSVANFYELVNFGAPDGILGSKVNNLGNDMIHSKARSINVPNFVPF